MFLYVLAAVCAVGVVLLASRLVKGTRDSDPDGPTSGYVGEMLSAFFLLAFAIAIVVPWTSIDSARQNTYTESQAIAEPYWSASQLPAPAAERTEAELRDYVDLVRGPEWELMADGKLSPDGWALLERIRREVIALEADTDEESDTRADLLDHIREITAARRQRAVDANTTPPTGLLVITVLTGLIVIGLPFLLGARPTGRLLIPLSLMAGLLGIGIYLVFDISHVFTGALAVQPDAFTTVLSELRRISEGA